MTPPFSLPLLVESLIDWYKWKTKMTVINNNYRSSLLSFPDKAYIYIYVRMNMNFPKVYNYRRINDPGYEEDSPYTRVFNKNAEIIAKLPKKYEYSNGS